MKEPNSHTVSLNPTSLKKNMKFNTTCQLKLYTMSLFTDPGLIDLRMLILLRISCFVLRRAGKIINLSSRMRSIKLISIQLLHGISLKLSCISSVSSTSEWTHSPRIKSIQIALHSKLPKTSSPN